MAKKTRSTKKRNPQDATKRDTVGTKPRLTKLEAVVEDLTKRLSALEEFAVRRAGPKELQHLRG
jgi:hypothetical protein